MEMGWEEERRELGRGGLTEETFRSLPENLSLDPGWAGAWGCGRGASIRRKRWARWGRPGLFSRHSGSDFNMAHAVTLTPA